ncbi:geranyltranstransferase [Stappia aggregata IAM 12614]|uniref:Probable farnesyl diphosphate synthase n=1 Tax=Roseibium aggregatum (strain ATCC 25650 / DSM 13394 / JCM 20685 / NBRC 16684 / NCIMB 2208 / IAM 12614 / B1) TaxID=384765 RepID=A0NWZ2_ROSAI|nr:farnesyl diphosphate synthase [Roseibium aggregatum]EAV42628.1 geranyltranstransferase [Stappia aggregata IAM 12614] [Roseibium aggregatum IAM 12614]
MTLDPNQHLTFQAKFVEATLETLLADQALPGEQVRPPRLLAAMRHGALNGGKRLRPVLVMETANLFGRADDGVLQAACALELVHCYSLVHDDLPAMDDDDLRRGQPTVHKAYDEATAILAGDALLTLAFDVITGEAVHADAAVRLRLSRELARASGFGGMAGGQMLDLESEHRERTEAEIRQLQSMKTGALLRYACRAGAILADAPEADIDRLTRFGEVIGLAFQLADDLLDVEASAETMGKATGKDAEAGKATLVGLWGTVRTRDELGHLVREAETLLAPYGSRAAILSALARFIVDRTN